MSLRAARWLLAVYLILGTVALTFPGIVPFNRLRPSVLGLPFVIAWVAFWVALGLVVLLVLDHAVHRSGSDRD